MPSVTKFDIELWVKTVASGEFHYKEVLDGKIDPASYGKLRSYLSELCHPQTGYPICESIGKHNGWYRPIQEGVQPVDFNNTEGHRDFPVILPFDLRKYVFIYPNTAIVVAGSKSSGKTGLLYRTIALNLGKINIKLLSNMEGGKEQMYDRFMAMGIDLTQQSKFVYPVSENFHDYVREPDTLYIIDYIDAPEGTDFYLIGGAISKIRKKLNDSVAVIGLQKPSFRDIAFGGEQTLKDTALYLAMDSNKIKIVDAKVPASKSVHPKNMRWSFVYKDEGTEFLNIRQIYDAGQMELDEEVPF